MRRIVRQSMCCADSGRDTLSRWHREAEALVVGSGLAYTMLRPNSFMQNFVTIYGPSIRGDDSFRLPLGTAAMSSVDVRDVAAAATAALIDEVDADVFTLTGPEALTGARDGGRAHRGHRPADRLRRRARRRRSCSRASADERAVGDALREFGAEMRAGRLAVVTGDVERLTGRPADRLRPVRARPRLGVRARRPFSGISQSKRANERQGQMR